MLRRAVLAAFFCVPAVSSVRAEEACRRAPEPVCMADWAVALASKGTADAFRRQAVSVRLRLGRVAEAHRMLGDPLANSPDPNAGEIAARIGNPALAQRILREARARLEAMPAGRVLFRRYRELAEAHRRAGDLDQARATLRRAADRIRSKGATEDAAAAARELARVGLELLRAGDRDAARALAAEAQAQAPLEEGALGARDDALPALVAALRAYDAIARLRTSLGDGEPLSRTLAALAPKVASASMASAADRAGLAVLALGRIAAAQALLGNRAAALRALALAQDLQEQTPSAAVPAQALMPAYAALGAWDAASRSAKTVPDADPPHLFLAVEQGRQGALKESVATALGLPAEHRAQALAEAALAATEDR